MKYFILLFFFLSGCATTEVARPHLHNFPYLDDCPSLEEKAIDNEELLKAQAKVLNMRYVDYLHLLTMKGIMPRDPLETKNIDLTTTE